MHRKISCVNRGSERFFYHIYGLITENLYHNYTIAACKPLYPNVKLEDGSFQQYEETLMKFNRKIYQWLMNSYLNVSHDNLHPSFCSTTHIKQSQIARTVRHSSKGIIISEAFLDSDGKYSHETFLT